MWDDPTQPLPDVVEVARSFSDRARFGEVHGGHFLVGEVVLHRPDRPDATQVSVVGLLPTGKADPNALLAYPVLKRGTTFPSMITIGRTANNDIRLLDTSVSKFHAYFRSGDDPGSFELSDAGSRNGTWIGGRALERKGPSLPVKLGDAIRIGKVQLRFVDAGGLWDRVHVPRRRGDLPDKID